MTMMMKIGLEARLLSIINHNKWMRMMIMILEKQMFNTIITAIMLTMEIILRSTVIE